ncbi:MULTISPECIES: CYTH and CHAD domain-containing protein [unclassified Bradyrhizobium]|uniref:CYTH and CHAD domain-containing protein n=1 Tax=unclassified Bradyrhizobium TaxID=2631580 RepID=UPI0015CC775F|nr:MULTISPECIES: CYTH and CHAD domain-containing protein [unclassified Bradyrhizobium]MBB4260594.1 inorganic triphosphatase YgiF [Bradyrhizobium sp. CIR3A]NYG46863.1 inorganic triphosphatase YgiF [Bradyrhizobium sp. IAR9]
MASETELKFRVAPRKLSSVLRTGGLSGRRGDQSEQSLVSTYYDTTKHKLRRHGLTLRVRKIEGRYVQTVKAGGTDGVKRGEWEHEVSGARPDLNKTGHTPLRNLATRKLPRKLKPVFQTDIHRLAQARRVRKSQIELAVDRGRISAGHRSRPVAELELELKSGHVADLFRLARDLERKTGAELDLRSKSERGYLLVAGSGGGAQHAEPIALEDGLSPREAFRVIAHSTLRQVTANADPVREMDAEGVHQMRVGLRRLRAAISLFADILPRASTARIKAELKWLTSELAPAREIDVFLNESIRPITERDVPRRGARAIRKRFSRQRVAAFERARDAVMSAPYRRLLIDVIEWIGSGRPHGDDDRSIAAYAAALLDRRIRKARKEGKRLHDLDPMQRHKLRIKIKKIRYAVDFFESLYADRDRKELAALSDRLKQIQSALGSLNDFMAHRELATEAALTAPPAHRRAQAFASGVVVGQEREAADGLMKDATKELSRLRRLRAMPSARA